MASFTHDHRILSFSSPLGTDKLLVESFHGVEAISELFDFDIELLATLATTVNPADLIGKRVTLNLQVDDANTKRSFNGMVASLKSFGADSDFQSFRLRMVPTLWLLSLNTQTRVFQGKTVVDIIKAVLNPYSITPTDDTQIAYTPLDYCTQYRETDLAFISRLMEQHGIFYFFTHTASDHTMVLADNSAQLPPCAVISTLPYDPDREGRRGFFFATIETFNLSTSLVTGQSTLWDYQFAQYTASKSSPASSATKATLGSNAHEHYDYAEASAYLKTESSLGKTVTLQGQFQNVLRDRLDAESVQGSGRSNAGVLQPGTTFTLKDFPRADANIKYLTTRVQHRGNQRPSYRTEEQARTQEPYLNLFQVQPASLAFRAPLVTPRPRVHGVVTGKVVAPAGDESYLDKYGRVCVQFWWDRTRKPNTTDNTLLRVAQSWAGKGWGSYFWPRLDDEVLIEFLDGDPDHPIVVGSLYNGVNLPKYDPAGQYTRSGIVTRSSKGGGEDNANELRFDDLKGSEQIFINAEKDFDTHVEHDRHTQVDNDEHLIVTGKRYVEVDDEVHHTLKKDVVESMGADHHLDITGKESVSVGGDQGVKVDGAYSLAVTGAASQNFTQALNQKVGMNHSLQAGMNSYNKTGMVHVIDAGMEVHLKGALKVVIESELEICLSTPGGFIVISPAGVTIQGIMVMINSGGAPVPGTPGSPEDPQAPAAPKSPTAPTWPGDDSRS